MQQVGGLIGRQVGGRAVADGRDPVLSFEAGPFGRAAGDDFDDQQGAVLGLEFDAQADKVSFDLRIDVVQLVAGQIGRIFVETAGGAASIFQNDGGRRQTQLLPGQLDGQGDGVDRLLAVADRLALHLLHQLLAEGVDFGPAGIQAGLTDKCRFAQAPPPSRRCRGGRGRPSRARRRSAIGFWRGLRRRGPAFRVGRGSRASGESWSRGSGGRGRNGSWRARAGWPGRGRPGSREGFFVQRDRLAPAVLVFQLLAAPHDAFDLGVIGRRLLTATGWLALLLLRTLRRPMPKRRWKGKTSAGATCQERTVDSRRIGQIFSPGGRENSLDQSRLGRRWAGRAERVCNQWPRSI